MRKRIVSIFSTAVIAVSVLLAATATVPRLFGLVPYGIVSGSMEPTIPVGSLAFVDIGDRSPEVRDVVAFRAGDQVVTHRVIDVSLDGYVTKGDANETRDPNVLQGSQVLGVYRTHVPVLGFLFLSLPVKATWVVLLVLAAILPPVTERKVCKS